MPMLAVIALALSTTLGAPSPSLANGGPETEAPFDHSVFDELLVRWVAPDGVRYAAWHAREEDRRALDAYVERLAAGRPGGMVRDDALAFWIDAYNALTLKLILDHYPVKSIKDLRSPWKRKLVTVEGRELSLDEIENDVIRKQWDEPRIHFALNCASVSCPPLRPGAFTGDGLDAQLEEQTVAFLRGPGARLDDDGKLRLSKIFQWYRGDFEKEGRTLMDWLRPYLAELSSGDGRDPKVSFEGYDWALNEAEE